MEIQLKSTTTFYFTTEIFVFYLDFIGNRDSHLRGLRLLTLKVKFIKKASYETIYERKCHLPLCWIEVGIISRLVKFGAANC